MIIGLERIIQNRLSQIMNMKVGDYGYSVPWAVCILKNGDIMLNKSCVLYKDANDTLTLFVKRTVEGYDLDFSQVETFEGFADTLEEVVESDPDDSIENWIKVGNVSEEYKKHAEKSMEKKKI